MTKKQHKKARREAKLAARRKPRPSRNIWIIGGIVVVAVIAVVLIGRSITQSQRAGSAFAAAVQRGKSKLTAVKTLPDEGRSHVGPGQSVIYSSDPPTSGPHDPTWVQPGFYTSPQRPERLVHALEHGNVVIYYDQPGADVADTLRRWAGLYRGDWDGLIVAPKTGLGQTVILTAWRKSLTLTPFDPDAAAAFVDAYRGRGPERPVR